MHTLKLTITYDGTDYSGWQIQSGRKTIQGSLEEAVQCVWGRHIRVYGASRTDSGVHALAQVAHLKCPNMIPPKKARIALNSVLPADIAVVKAEYKPDGFHAQYDAVLKTYIYHIYNSRQRDPFKERYAWRVPYDLDVRLMNREARMLLGRQDYRSFQATDKKPRSSVRTVRSVVVSKNKDMIKVIIRADGFLYNMVRNIVGTLIDIGRGYLDPGSMKNILSSCDRTKAGPTAPPQGLFLVKIKY